MTITLFHVIKYEKMGTQSALWGPEVYVRIHGPSDDIRRSTIEKTSFRINPKYKVLKKNTLESRWSRD